MVLHTKKGKKNSNLNSVYVDMSIEYLIKQPCSSLNSPDAYVQYGDKLHVSAVIINIQSV